VVDWAISLGKSEEKDQGVFPRDSKQGNTGAKRTYFDTTFKAFLWSNAIVPPW